MAFDPAANLAPAPTTEPPPPADAPARCKVRLRFGKGFDLRLLSHHDLLRAFERLFRRADLPLAHTQGFNPHPRIVFALSLPLGVIGLEEVVEIELDRPFDTEELRCRLAGQAPPGLRFHGLKSIALKANARVARLTYRLPAPDDRLAALHAAIPPLLNQPQLLVRRVRTPGQSVDLRPSIHQLRLVEIADASALPGLAGAQRSTWHHTLELELTPTPAGTARPEEVLALLEQPDLLDLGGVLERSRLLLVDELPPITVEGTSCPRSC